MRHIPSWCLMPPPATTSPSGLHPWQALGWLLVLLAVTALIGALARPALWFWFHLRRGLAMLACLCGWFLCAVADAVWATVTLRGRRARRAAGEREFSLKGISRRDRDVFVDAIRIIHGDLAKAAAEADRRANGGVA